jgi:cobalamin biosynthesis Co2+ chelatase CbiK
MAFVKAVSSFWKEASPPEAQRPRRSEVLVLMAAGMARMGSFAVFACYDQSMVSETRQSVLVYKYEGFKRTTIV